MARGPYEESIVEEHGDTYVVLDYPNGNKSFWSKDSAGNFVRHRETGPAIIWSGGAGNWIWYNIDLTEEVREQEIYKLEPEEIRFWLPILAAQKGQLL